MNPLKSLFKKKPQLPSLASLGYSPQEQEAKEYITHLNSTNWRDWEDACVALGKMRVDSAIPKIAKLVERDEGKRIVNVTELALGTIFNIGGPTAIRWFQYIDYSFIARKFHDVQSGDFRRWARDGAAGLQLLQDNMDITPQVIEFVLALRKDSYKPNCTNEMLAPLTIPELWNVVAAEPGLLTRCMEDAASKLEGMIEGGESISEQEQKYTINFGSLAEEVKWLFLQTNKYVGHYSTYPRFENAWKKINRIVVDNLGGWPAD